MEKAKITPSNIKSFFQGYSRYYYDNIFGLPEHIKQQVAYRIYTCRDTCLKDKGVCEKCGCPTIKKAYATESCNKGEKFPDLMDRISWIRFMEEKGITDQITAIQSEVDELIAMNNKN